MEIIKTQTEQQYSKGCSWLRNYAKNSNGKTKSESGDLAVYTNSVKIIAYSYFKEFEIYGDNAKEINFIKSSLEKIINSERKYKAERDKLPSLSSIKTQYGNEMEDFVK